MKLITRLLINILSLLIVSYIIPGFDITNLTTAAVAAVVIGIVNTFIKPILLIITLPITIITFGIFALILNVLMLMLAAAITPGFHIDGFFTALLASILLSLVSSFLNALLRD